MKVGGCYPEEDLIACTGGGNEYKTGGSCVPGNKEGISITCSGQTNKYSSCADEGNIFFIDEKLDSNSSIYNKYLRDLHGYVMIRSLNT